MKYKIALFCNVEKDCVIENLDAETLYQVPLMLEEEGLAKIVCRKLGIDCPEPDLAEWKEMIEKDLYRTNRTKVALVGKYVELHDAYLSIVESLHHAGIHNSTNVEIDWINAENVTKDNVDELLKNVDGILVPGGFGDRGVEGKIEAVRYARENKIPFLGICLGMQCAVIEFARNVAGLKGAHSSELAPNTKYPVIDIMPDQKNIEDMGGTMRLGAYPCVLKEESNAYKAYRERKIEERHRHRYEFNNEYRELLISKGLKITGTSPDNCLVEIVEVEEHPWFVGVQFHPEFLSRPNRPHPLFKDFIAATLKDKEQD